MDWEQSATHLEENNFTSLSHTLPPDTLLNGLKPLLDIIKLLKY